MSSRDIRGSGKENSLKERPGKGRMMEYDRGSPPTVRQRHSTFKVIRFDRFQRGMVRAADNKGELSGLIKGEIPRSGIEIATCAFPNAPGARFNQIDIIVYYFLLGAFQPRGGGDFNPFSRQGFSGSEEGVFYQSQAKRSTLIAAPAVANKKRKKNGRMIRLMAAPSSS